VKKHCTKKYARIFKTSQAEIVSWRNSGTRRCGKIFHSTVAAPGRHRFYMRVA